MTLGITCLTTEDEAQALELGRELDRINRERREIEAGMQEQALALLERLMADPRLKGEPPAALAIFDADFHEGVVGIVASRIKDRLHRPVFVFAEGADGQLKGSGRSIAGFHMRDALDLISKRHPELLRKFGGHAMAAGCTLAPGGSRPSPQPSRTWRASGASAAGRGAAFEAAVEAGSDAAGCDLVWSDRAVAGAGDAGLSAQLGRVPGAAAGADGGGGDGGLRAGAGSEPLSPPARHDDCRPPFARFGPAAAQSKGITMPAYKDDGKLWVLVADEGVARLLRLPEEGGDLEDVTTLTDAAAHADKADLRRDAEGRRGNSVVSSAGVDELHQEAISFAARVAKTLDDGYNNGEVTALRIVAAPRFLGLLRKAISPQIARIVLDENNVDVVHESLGEGRPEWGHHDLVGIAVVTPHAHHASATARPAEHRPVRHHSRRDARIHFQPLVEVERAQILGYEALTRGPADTPLHSPLVLFETAPAPAGSSSSNAWSCAARCAASRSSSSRPALPEPDRRHPARHQRPRALIAREFAQLDLPASRVVIELTETRPILEPERLQDSMRSLRELGFVVALDDLGEGFASLKRWMDIRPDFVKIDRHFIDGIAQEPSSSNSCGRSWRWPPPPAAPSWPKAWSSSAT
ncbi:protein required for attachment to host cells domain-containing protein [Ditylenchus destructor]|nr:protein required for attachment to host cells domain-containing protein [Ditylenchus destructor]